MDGLNGIKEAQKELESTFSKRFMELEAALKTASPLTHPTIASLSKEVSTFKTQMSSMLQLLKKQIEEISSTVDSIEMRHRKKFLLFNGIPEVAGEDIVSKVTNVCQNNLSLQSVSQESILVCYRLGIQPASASSSHSRPVLVRFNDHRMRSSVWTNKKALKGTSIVITEFLTKQRQSLFIDARKHFGTRMVWTTDGNIFIKLPDGKKLRLSSENQLEALKSQHDPVVLPRPAQSKASKAASTAASAGSADAQVPSAGPAPAPQATETVPTTVSTKKRR
ncbi:uncharacterized protein LOC134670859 [Cydia fagiglandana]|uniref:uncharacterized protein LOC134670859 n=1 Tax=Cydia fagiglandana TaxID=1458189 RepID=UPI002FEE46AB